ncbi:Ig-like domain-containing alpha-2-macroglobulin family protein [Solimonas marina]|uniref:Large extracellular alpha-helical protein n=1 Tax=Solimonas marina TaxID=2714601 RepID=A0A969WDF4_9GAMM|nr:Ig-like domain-containing alpha-2-macroglobulin family protein [Solimonas marina]NKF23371.1 large extracellular alpha-helical protein [Solimonas marina]
MRASRSARLERAAALAALLSIAGVAHADALKLLRVTPAGDDVPAKSQIVLAFDRDMVPLGRMERSGDEIPVTVTPSPDCQWRWLDTQNLACQPADGASLRAATAYTVAIADGFVALDGSVLAPATYRFSTALPRVQYARVEQWNGPTQPQVMVRFNQPVTAASVATAVRFGNAAADVSSAYYDDDTPFWTPDGEARSTWLLTPTSPLPADATVALRAGPGLRSALGPLPGAERRDVLTMQTFAAPRLVGLECNDGQQTRLVDAGVACAPLDGVALVFTAPVARSDLLAALQITPDPRGDAKPEADAGDDADQDDGSGADDDGAVVVRGNHRKDQHYRVRLPFPLKAEAEYQLSVAGTLQDRFGRALGKTTALTLRTRIREPKLVFEHSPAVLETDVDSEVPAIVTNLDRLSLSGSRTTADGTSVAQREIKLPPVRNLAFATPLQIRELLGAHSGVVRGGLTSTPATSKKPRPFFAEVTPWEVHAKYGNANTLVWVTSMADGQPAAGVDVAVLDGWQGKAQATATTDADGLAWLPGGAELDPQLTRLYQSVNDDDKPPLVLRVSKGQDLAMLPLSNEFEIDTWRASREQIYDWRRARHGHLRAWGTTAQGVYRAGDTIQYKLYVRDDDQRSLAPAPDHSYTLRIIDPTGNTVQERKDLRLSAFGAIDGELKLPRSAAVGWYRAELQPSYADDLTLSPLRVLVSDFVPAPFHVSAELRGDEAAPGREIGAEVRATLHGGGPFANAQARITARVESAPFEPHNTLAQRYDFDTWQPGGRDTAPLVDQQATLDGNGAWQTTIVPGDASVLVGKLVVEATVQDDRGASIVGQARIPYFGRDRYIGIEQHGWVRAGTPATLGTLVVDRDGQPQSGAPYYVKIERKLTKGARVKGAGNAYITRYVSDWQRVATCKGRSHAGGDTCTFTPDAGGELRATAMVQDRHGRLHSSTTCIYAQGNNAVLWEDRPDYSLDVRIDKPSYKVGDVARLFVKNPYPGAQALITVERYGVLTRRLQVLQTATPVIEIPIKPDYLPGAYVSVVVMSPRQSQPIKNGVDLGKPALRIGYAKLQVDDPYRQLKVDVKPSRDEVRPRVPVAVTLQATPRHGDKTPVEFAVAVLDEAVFDLIQGGTTYFDPLQGFTQLDALDLSNYSLLTRLIGRQKFEKKGASSGGDGGGDLSLRSIDKFVAYWNPSLKADADGRAQFTFTTPDNLSGWRVLAMAVTPGDRMGLGQATVHVNKPTEIRSALPNQLSRGDHVDAVFTITNRTPRTRTIDVTIEASGAAQGKTTQRVSLQSFERGKVALPLDVASSGAVHFAVQAGEGDDGDALQADVPVHERPLTVAAAGFSALTAEAPLTVPLKLPPDTPRAELRLDVASSLLGDLGGAFTYMADYPYLCWEQRLTKAVMAAHFEKLHDRLASPPDWPGADTLTQRTLDDAASFQAPGGGMTFFVPKDEHQSPYLSAYTALAFGWLQQMGYQPPAEVWDKLDGYLQTLLHDDLGVDGFGTAELRAQIRAVALAALAQHGKLKAADLQRYQPQLPRMGLFGEALYAQAAAQTAGAAAPLQAAQQRLLARAQQSAGTVLLDDDQSASYPWTLGSKIGSNCAALSALLADDDADEAPLVMKLTRAIAQARGVHTYWINTQANVFCTRALIQYADRYEATPLAMTVRALLDGTELGSAQLADGRSATIAKPLDAEAASAARQLQVRGDGQGRAYVTTTLRYATAPPTEPLQAGLSVSRAYFVRRDGQWQPLGGPLMTVKQGEQLKIELSLSVPAWMTYVVVDDPVPAGLEPVNPDLATASGLSANEMAQASPAYPYPFYYRALRFDVVRFYADSIGAGQYKLAWIGQAVATGTFAVAETHAERMYDPDVFGNGVATRLKVEPGT